MRPTAGHTVPLTDGRGRDIGRVIVERVDDDLIEGAFEPGADFGAVRQLFLDFEEAVNLQALGAADRLGGEIDALRFRLGVEGQSESIDVFDVQIWSEGGISCRLRSRTRA
jgi:hypothetical protein